MIKYYSYYLFSWIEGNIPVFEGELLKNNTTSSVINNVICKKKSRSLIKRHMLLTIYQKTHQTSLGTPWRPTWPPRGSHDALDPLGPWRPLNSLFSNHIIWIYDLKVSARGTVQCLGHFVLFEMSNWEWRSFKTSFAGFWMIMNIFI